MLATLAVAVAAALGPPIVLPELEHDVSVALGDDNRVGFAFASLTLGAECGVDSTIAHSRAHIAAAAKVLSLNLLSFAFALFFSRFSWGNRLLRSRRHA